MSAEVPDYYHWYCCLSVLLFPCDSEHYLLKVNKFMSWQIESDLLLTEPLDYILKQESVDDEQNLDVKELIAQGLDEVRRLSELSRDADLQKLDEEPEGNEEDESVTVSATELLKINNRIQQLLALLTVCINQSIDQQTFI